MASDAHPHAGAHRHHHGGPGRHYDAAGDARRSQGRDKHAEAAALQLGRSGLRGLGGGGVDSFVHALTNARPPGGDDMQR